MAEVNALPPNGFTVASTFSGGGGSSTGYRMAGYRVVYANEFIESARQTYRANHPTTVLDDRDIRKVSPADVLDTAGLAPGELDLFDGSPPCSAFSTAGKREKGWGKAKGYSDDAKQVVDDLFFEFSRLLRGIRPKVFVAENVSGLVKGTAKGYFKLILAELRSCGYDVRAALLNAQWLGVPQSRERLIFIGVRSDLGVAPSHPKPLPYCYTLGDGILDLAGTIVAKKIAHSESVPENYAASMRGYAVESQWERIAPGESSEKFFSLVRCRFDRPCPTVTAMGGAGPGGAPGGVASISHPTECRKFSISELKRISSFPDDYVLHGTYGQQWERMGRSVPPLMMRAISAHIRDAILTRVSA